MITSFAQRRASAIFAALAATLPLTLAANLSHAADALPKQMQAVRADTEAAPGTMKLVTVDVPTPGAGQLLIRVYAASANPSDWGIRGGGAPRAGGAPGAMPPGGPPAGAPGAGPAGPPAAGPPAGGPPGMMMNRNPGNDVSGVVVALGTGVTKFKVGDKVVAALQNTGGGAYAEYAILGEQFTSLKPPSYSFEQAAGIPTAGFTGLRMVKLAKVQRGERVLVIGAAGGVGSAAVQAAKSMGAYVISSASSRHVDYLKKLGVDQLISYDKENVAELAKNVDVVIVTVGSENAAGVGYAKTGGRVITIAGQADQAACAAKQLSCMTGGPGQSPTVGELIAELVDMANKGQFTVVIDEVFPLARINDAFVLGRAGNRQGKMAITAHQDSATR